MIVESTKRVREASHQVTLHGTIGHVIEIPTTEYGRKCAIKISHSVAEKALSNHANDMYDGPIK